MPIRRPKQPGRTELSDLEVAGSTGVVVDESNKRLGIGLAVPKTRLTVEGAVTLKEQAAADTDTAAYGQLWVKTATPNQLYFTTDAGDDIQLTSGTATAFVGDITGVTAGNGLSGGGTSGALSLALDLNELSAAAVNVANDSIVIVDADDSNASKKESIADLATAMAGTGLSASSGQLTVDSITSVGAVNSGSITSGFGSIDVGSSTITTTGNISGADVTVSGGDIGFGNGQNATVTIADTAHNAAGKTLTIEAGNTTAGTTNNIAGGSLTLKAGAGKGSGAGGDIVFQTANAGGSGSSMNSHATALTISDDLGATFAGDVVISGTTPQLTIGDGGAEDTLLVFDGNAADWRMGIDDGTDVLEIGVGAAHGTTTAIGVNANAQTQVLAAFAANVAGTFGTFADGDGTPSVATGNLWKHHNSTQTITMFDDGIAGQTIHVISTAAITYDVTDTNLKGGSTDIVTANGDITSWFFDGTNWYLIQFMDVSADMSSVGGGGGTDLNGLSAAAVDVAADSIGIIDANDSNNSKKESIADLATAMAGTGVTATNGVFSLDVGASATGFVSGGVRGTPDQLGEVLFMSTFAF